MIPKIKTFYSPWKHPIKWWRERKLRRILQVFVSHKYPQIEQELLKAQVDMMLYGHAVMKGGKHVPIRNII